MIQIVISSPAAPNAPKATIPKDQTAPLFAEDMACARTFSGSKRPASATLSLRSRMKE